MEYMMARDAARKWKISVRLVQQYCVDGRIEGARKFSGAWAFLPVRKNRQMPEKKRRLPGRHRLDQRQHLRSLHRPCAVRRCL